MKLTYWYAECLGDVDQYSIITKTKREAQELRAENPQYYGPVQKREIIYADAFDLFSMVTGEGGGRDYGTKVGKGDDMK